MVQFFIKAVPKHNQFCEVLIGWKLRRVVKCIQKQMESNGNGMLRKLLETDHFLTWHFHVISFFFTFENAAQFSASQDVTELISFRHGFDKQLYQAYGACCLPNCFSLWNGWFDERLDKWDGDSRVYFNNMCMIKQIRRAIRRTIGRRKRRFVERLKN